MTAAAESPEPGDPEPNRPTGPVVLRDPRAIKALAHPARLAVIDAFFAGRRLTATECGDIAGLSASAMSYHLRALERWGIIRRSQATGDGRERPWEAAGDRLAVESSEPRATAAGEAMLVATMLDRITAETLAWVATQDRDWYDSVAISSGSCWLTADEARELAEAVAEVVAGYQRRSGADAPPDARRVRVAYTVVPITEEVPGGAAEPGQGRAAEPGQGRAAEPGQGRAADPVPGGVDEQDPEVAVLAAGDAPPVGRGEQAGRERRPAGDRTANRVGRPS